MRKDRWIQIGCTLAAVCIVGGGSMLVSAGETLDVESAVAGMAVPLNNYFAGSLNPEEELRQFLDSYVIINQEPAPEDPLVGEPTGEYEEETSAEETSAEETSPEETSPEETSEEETTTQMPVEDPLVGEPTEPETEAPKVSPYANVAVSHVRKDSFVNVRSEPNTTSEKLGKLYNDCAATILNTVEGEDGLWYEIQSGSVRGYIKSEYFLTGDEAEARAIEIGKLEGKVNTNGLRLRREPNLDSKILTLLYAGEKYIVVEEGAEWVKVMVDDDLEGYVYREYVDITLQFDTAISKEEERKMKEEEARKKREAEEAARRLEEARRAEEERKRQEEEAKRQEEENKNNGDNNSGNSGSSSEVSSASRDALVKYALQWVGVSPYVYGGESLTNGIDCSAFVRACYQNALGVGLPRTSRSQADKCTRISEGDLKPGDLVFYNDGSGTINHVAMYIGGGQVVHASNKKLGTIVSNMKYREPCMYGRFIQ
ncbi:MAG: C40 family peptidase [Lachnospiraceae bacterium]|nr:C40 family peptidase [Lachnospiraceae bacterium]